MYIISLFLPKSYADNGWRVYLGKRDVWNFDTNLDANVGTELGVSAVYHPSTVTSVTTTAEGEESTRYINEEIGIDTQTGFHLGSFERK